MSFHSLHQPFTAIDSQQPTNSSAEPTPLSPPSPTPTPIQAAISHDPTITSGPSLDSPSRKASELAAVRSTDRRDERRQTAVELAAAMPDCLNCHNKAKLNCANQRCHACCTAMNTPCKAHSMHSTGSKRQRSPTSALSSAADRATMLNALAVDDAIGSVVMGVVDAVVDCGYRVRLLVNGYVCEGLLFDDTYAVTVNTLPDELSTKELQRITLDSLPTLPATDRPLLPPPSLSPPATAASQSKAKVRHPDGYPKGPRSAYVFYTAAMRARAQTAESDEERAAVKVDWSVLSERERAPYVRLAQLDKERWMREMTEWKRRTEEGDAGEAVEESSVDMAAVANPL